jgi:HSP20 family molecular chaperone IbpA
MSIIMNESLGSLEYDGLINSAYPADIVHASLSSGYGELKRGYLIAKDSSGNLIPWGSDITDDLSEALTVTSHVATKSQAGLDATKLKVFAADFLNVAEKPDDEKKVTIEVAGLDETSLVVKAKKLLSESLTVTDHVATKSAAGLDAESLVVKVGDATLEEETDYTVAYESNTLTITLVETSEHYTAEALAVTCDYAAYDTLTETTHYTATYANDVLTITMTDLTEYTDTSSVKVYCEYDEDTFIPIEKTTDYTSTYSANTLTVTLVATSEYYDTPKVKVVCPYAYSEATIAAGNLILAEDVDTGSASGQTVVARAYRTGIFNQNKLLYNAKALGGITDITKEKLRSIGILLNDSIS